MQHWNGRLIEIQSIAQAKTLWVTARIKVFIDNLLVAESPNSWNRGKGSLKFTQTDKDVPRKFRIEFDSRFSIVYVKYKIYIDDDLYTTGKLLPTNWYMSFFVFAVVLIFSLIL